MTNNRHPITHLKTHLLKRFPNLVLEFSKYVYVAYGETRSRRVFHVKAKDVVDGWLEEQINAMTEEEELALHSRVKRYEDDENVLHIPMIDFVNKYSQTEILDKIQPINKKLDSDVWLYNSGNSYHGYFYILMIESEWYKYLGSLLLCNPPSKFDKEVVDSRWVGHCLEHGFSALRWSRNTEKYKLSPTFSTTSRSKNKDLESLFFEVK